MFYDFIYKLKHNIRWNGFFILGLHKSIGVVLCIHGDMIEMLDWLCLWLSESWEVSSDDEDDDVSAVKADASI